MKRTPLANLIVKGLIARGYEKMERTATETRLRCSPKKIAYIVHNGGRVLSRFKKEDWTEVCH